MTSPKPVHVAFTTPPPFLVLTLAPGSQPRSMWIRNSIQRLWHWLARHMSSALVQWHKQFSKFCVMPSLPPFLHSFSLQMSGSSSCHNRTSQLLSTLKLGVSHVPWPCMPLTGAMLSSSANVRLQMSSPGLAIEQWHGSATSYLMLPPVALSPTSGTFPPFTTFLSVHHNPLQ